METKTRILIADPDPDYCKLLAELMSTEPKLEVVATAGDGLETLTLAKEHNPDVILMDLILPKLDGLEVLKLLSEADIHSHVVVLSGFANTKVVSNCSSLGVDYFMPKPCDMSALLSRIRTLSDSIHSELPSDGVDFQLTQPEKKDAELVKLESLVTDIIHEACYRHHPRNRRTRPH